MIKIAPSVLSADFGKLKDEIVWVEQCGADWLHLDVMDGIFVPNITIGPLVLEAVKPLTGLFMDVHLMITAPEKHIDAFCRAGADLITVHAEACPHLHRVLSMIREKGVKAGVALNPSTSEQVIDYVWDVLDLVLVMSVNPGFGGQSFIPGVLPKIKKIAERINKTGRAVELQVDGGVNPDTYRTVIDAGATTLVAGSAIFNARRDPDIIRIMKKYNKKT